jgi:hypothetical protein
MIITQENNNNPNPQVIQRGPLLSGNTCYSQNGIPQMNIPCPPPQLTAQPTQPMTQPQLNYQTYQTTPPTSTQQDILQEAAHQSNISQPPDFVLNQCINTLSKESVGPIGLRAAIIDLNFSYPPSMNDIFQVNSELHLIKLHTIPGEVYQVSESGELVKIIFPLPVSASLIIQAP